MTSDTLSSPDFVQRNLDNILLVAFGFGQFLSRSNHSVTLMRVPLSMSVIQSINLILMLLNTNYLYVTNITVLCLFQIFVGFISGATYLNTIFIIHKKRMKELMRSGNPVVDVPFEDREIAINVCLMGMDIGDLTSSVITKLIL